MTEIIKYEDITAVAKAMSASRYFTDAQDHNKAIVKIVAGREMGLGPFASMTGIHIIKGKPVLGANLIATLIKNDPRYDYRVTEHTDKVCTIAFYQGGQVVGESSITIDELRKAGSQNLDKYPRNMLFARAISNGAKWHTPGIFGGAPVYTPDEFEMEVDEDGEPVVIEGTLQEVEDEPAPKTTTAQNWPIQAIDWMVEKGYVENEFQARGRLKKCAINPDDHPGKLSLVLGPWNVDYNTAKKDGKTSDEAAEIANELYAGNAE